MLDTIPTSPNRRRPLDRDRIRLGIRVALEEMIVGRDYARVETILRALADEPGSEAPPHRGASRAA